MTDVNELPQTLEKFDRVLTESGYRKYLSSVHKHAEFFYQKRISDNRGTLFFIDCYLYNLPEMYQNIAVEIDVYFTGESGK